MRLAARELEKKKISNGEKKRAEARKRQENGSGAVKAALLELKAKAWFLRLRRLVEHLQALREELK